MTTNAATLKTISALTGLIFLVGCAGPRPVAYTGLSSAGYLKPSSDDSGKIPYAYTTKVNWQNYTKVIVDPVTIYDGADNQFGSMTQKDKAELAKYMRTTFEDALSSQRFTVVPTPGPGTLEIKLILTGAAITPLIGKFAHIDMGGNVYNIVQAIRGQQGLESGWVMYAVEIHDSASGELLKAYEAKQYPNALNIHAAFGSLSAAKIGLDKGADALAEQLSSGS